ncbi:MAG: aminotransferase class I/II-fold pyridoxal phosphate-dependent enzyme, partial [Acholeplasmatales bacterium]|nr:aminotransferase class I/II-fold pyridoxal phosphate-dependent enzyme [Acholeplasmatales bacterium]
LDFKEGGFENSRDIFLPLLKAKEHIVISICYSGSKSFSSYGLRLGALIILGKNEELINKTIDEQKIYARSSWSNPPSVGLNLFNYLMSDESLYSNYVNSLKQQIKVLEQRASIFISEARNCDLKILPYKAGFFITVLSKNSENDYEELIKNGIWVVPINNALRISIAGISTSKVIGLAKKIKDIIL